MWKPIKAYALLWNSQRQKGIVKLILEDSSEFKIKVKSCSELDAIGNILRNESPLSFNIRTGSIATGWEAVLDDDLETQEEIQPSVQ